MSDLREAAEELIKEWDWECGEHQNKALAELIEALRQALAQPDEVSAEREACAKAAEAVLEAWDWDWSEPRNEALRERMEALRKAAEMALEFIVLESSKDRAWFTEKEFEVVAALRQSLAQPEEKMHIEGNGKLTTKPYPDGYESEQQFRKALAQPEQEPVAIVNEGMGGIEWLSKPLPEDTPLYAAPVYAVNMSQKCVDENEKFKHEPEWIEDGYGTMWQKCGKKDCGKFVVKIGKVDCWNGDCPEAKENI